MRIESPPRYSAVRRNRRHAYLSGMSSVSTSAPPPAFLPFGLLSMVSGLSGGPGGPLLSSILMSSKFYPSSESFVGRSPCSPTLLTPEVDFYVVFGETSLSLSFLSSPFLSFPPLSSLPSFPPPSPPPPSRLIPSSFSLPSSLDPLSVSLLAQMKMLMTHQASYRRFRLPGISK